MTARVRRARQAGLTMIEIMVSVALVGIATAFVFSIQIKMSSALHDQQTVSEAQQTLRSASELILRDLRMSGYLAQQIAVSPAPGTVIGPVTVANGGVDGSPDQLTVIYADTTAIAPINSNTATLPAIFNGSDGYATSVGTYVRASAGFAAGDMVLLTHAGVNVIGTNTYGTGIGCLVAVTGVTPTTLIKTDPGAGGLPWNSPNNAHCSAGTFPNVYNDGLSEITKVFYRSYRIRPGDGRGILEMSRSGGRLNDYEPLAMGIVDMQIALRVWYPADQVATCATDADVRHDWLSSDNMNAAVFPVGAKVVEVSVSLLARTSKEVQGVTLAKTPDLFDGDLAHRGCNHVGDVTGTALPVLLPTTSMYYGDHVFRTYTATVDLRNANTQN